MTEATIHASAVNIGGRGVLIRGSAGSGKSSLLLQILSADPRDSHLVADDRVVLATDRGRLLASPPAALAGLIEIRGQGILRLPFVSPVAVDLVADLAGAVDCPRLPTAAERRTTLAGIVLPRIFIACGAADGHARIRAALNWPLYENA
jgi:serine kinase of HPr protein (carbohydrate metabolism regulator)